MESVATHATSAPGDPALAAPPFTIDGHQDALFYAAANGGEAAFDAGSPSLQIDLPGLRAGGVDAAFWAIFGECEQADVHDPATAAGEVDRLLARYCAWIARNPAYRVLCDAGDLQAAADAARAAAGGPAAPFGVLLHCEGARGIAGLEHLRALQASGLRSVGLTWNKANAYATGAHGDPESGLTPAGQALVRELNRLHMVVDGAHLSRRGLWDVLEISTAPVVVTHTGCAALYPDPRNLADDQIRAVAASGGLIGVFLANMFLAPDGAPVTIDTLLAHYDHLLALVGPDHVALGTDYGGVGTGLPAGLARVGDLPRLYAAFAAHGYPPATITAIRGGNYLRVLRQILA
ncbi:MAG TPA: membrane dipeptidase [Chloroflexia bacterium]|nr:membrane dipeptidase [Chloroflexia bacterium]